MNQWLNNNYTHKTKNMKLYEFLEVNKGIIDTLTKNGIIPCHVIGYKGIYEKVMYEQTVNKLGATDSYWKVSYELKLGINTIMIAVVKMRSEI